MATPDRELPPRCPACDARLYGWLTWSDPDRDRELVIDRCEACGLGVTRTGQPPDVEAELAVLRAGGTPERAGTDAPTGPQTGIELLSSGGRAYARVPNRESWQCSIGGAGWAALNPGDRRLHLTPRSLGLLAADLGLEVVEVGYVRFGRAQRWMWQTLLNAFTLRENFATDARAGRLQPRGLRGRAAFALDAVVSVLASILVIPLGTAIETLAALLRRGGELEVEVRPLPGTERAE